uniref:Maturase n=1 Tax=Chroomonas placoidea TaxID=173977 RepID=A0A2P1G814_9CRYP|nr:maturase [Chroomonas placoidea]AVM81093.1 maturase [Chroomonas placoidea]
MIFIKNLVSISRLRKEFFKFGIIRKTKKPKAIVYLITLYTQAILIWYNNLMFCLLYYYYKTFNYKKLVSNVYYFLKWSLLATLKKKHKKSVEKVILRYRKQKNNKVAPLLLRYNFATITTLKKCRRVSNNLFYIYEYGL